MLALGPVSLIASYLGNVVLIYANPRRRIPPELLIAYEPRCCRPPTLLTLVSVAFIAYSLPSYNYNTWLCRPHL